MLDSRRIYIALFCALFIFCACTPSSESYTPTSPVQATPSANASVKNTPTPAVSQLNVEKEALRGVQVKVWHPWFGAQASLFELQVASFNTGNEWGIVVSAQSKENYSELFSETDAALQDSSYPQIVVALPEQALTWDEHVVDLGPYVSDPLYGWNSFEVSDFPLVVWRQDEVDGKRYGVPAQRTARLLLYNQSWARELGFDSPPATSTDFEQQACAAHKALGTDF